MILQSGQFYTAWQVTVETEVSISFNFSISRSLKACITFIWSLTSLSFQQNDPILQGMRNKVCQNNSVDFVYEYQELIQCFLWILSWNVCEG